MHKSSFYHFLIKNGSLMKVYSDLWDTLYIRPGRKRINFEISICPLELKCYIAKEVILPNFKFVWLSLPPAPDFTFLQGEFTGGNRVKLEKAPKHPLEYFFLLFSLQKWVQQHHFHKKGPFWNNFPWKGSVGGCWNAVTKTCTIIGKIFQLLW